MAKKKASPKDGSSAINVFHPPATSTPKKEKKTDGNNQQTESAGEDKAKAKSGEGELGKSGSVSGDSKNT